MLGLIAILMSVMMVNCGGEKNSGSGKSDAKEANDEKDSKDKLMKLIENMKKDGNSWSLEEWESFNKDYFDAVEAFLFNEDITKEDCSEFDKLTDHAFYDLDKDALELQKKAVQNLRMDENIEKQLQRIEKRFDELSDKWFKKKDAEE